MDVIAAIEARRSIRKLNPAHVMTDEEIHRLLSLVTCSPTAFNIQHWRFVVVRNHAANAFAVGGGRIYVNDGVILGCAALYPFSKDKAAELACLAVNPDYRRAGYGEQLLHYMEARARKAGLKRLFVLTTRTSHWFIERGFKEASVDSLPREKRELYNWQRRSKVLSKTL